MHTDSESCDMVRSTARGWWTALQFCSVCATLPTGAAVLSMASAEPITQYITQSGVVVHCEAVERTRGRDKLTCAPYGSMQTNPRGFAMACVLFASAFGLLLYASQPGRGRLESSGRRRRQ